MRTNLFKNIFFILIIFLLILSVYILYIDKNNNSVDAKNEKLEIEMEKELNIGISKYDTINPILTKNRDIQYVDKLIFDSLIDFSYDFKIQNLLAQEISKINETTYIIKLKEDIYWHDNTHFTSEDVIFTINGLKNENIESIYKDNVKNIEQIINIDDYTIKILLDKEIPHFEYMLCFPILSKENYDEQTLESKDEKIIGTGKYKVFSIEENNIKIVKTEKTENLKINEINLILKDNIGEIYNSFSKSEIDLFITDGIEYEKYIGKMGYNINSSQNRNFEYICLNTKNKFLSDKRIRKAISMTIDKNKINYLVYNNKYINSNFPLDYECYLYKSENVSQYNINEAKEILIEAGWNYKNGMWQKNGSVLSFNLVINQEDENIGEEIKNELEEFGIKIRIVKLNKNIYNNYIKNKNYDMILTKNIIGIYPNLESYFGKENKSNFYNEKVLENLKDINNIESQDLLREKYEEIIKIYNEEMPCISLFFNPISIIYNDSIKGNMEHNWYNIFYNIDNWYKERK